MKKTYDFLKKCGVFYLATDEGSQPRVRPFGAVCIFEDRLCIMTNNQKDVYKQMTANPKIEISGMAGDEWIRLAAEAVRDERLEAKKAMLDENPDLRAMYNENDGIMEVLYLKNARVSVCSFTKAPDNWEF